LNINSSLFHDANKLKNLLLLGETKEDHCNHNW